MEKASRATDKTQPLTLFLEPNAGRFDRWFTFSGVHDLHEKRYALGRVLFHSQNHFESMNLMNLEWWEVPAKPCKAMKGPKIARSSVFPSLRKDSKLQPEMMVFVCAHRRDIPDDVWDTRFRLSGSSLGAETKANARDTLVFKVLNRS